uniref:Uncharacterized protein n=1 Tax=Arion vulgaris TaxID=1028688 RepID=A0A0B7AL60_9EUPU
MLEMYMLSMDHIRNVDVIHGSYKSTEIKIEILGGQLLEEIRHNVASLTKQSNAVDLFRVIWLTGENIEDVITLQINIGKSLQLLGLQIQ